jgi:hypothetical protein
MLLDDIRLLGNCWRWNACLFAPESQAKKQVMANRLRGRYTRARCTQEKVAVIGVLWAQTDVLKAVRQGG